MSEKKFQGRVVAAGTFSGEAVVSRVPVNILPTFQESALKKRKNAICEDRDNRDIYKKNLTGKALCLPASKGSTTAGIILQTICSMNIQPSAFLFSESIDSLAASGIVLARVWENCPLIAVDQLGDEFLQTVQTGDKVEIHEDGTVVIQPL